MSFSIKHWLRASLQGTTVLGVVLIAITWVTLIVHLDIGRRKAIDAASQNAENLARSFEAHIARAISDQDGTLLVLRAMHERDPASFNSVDWARYAGIISDVVMQYSVIDDTGVLVASSLTPFRTADMSDREHFRFHLGSQTDELFIGRRQISRLLGRDSIAISRRLHKPDGSFGGVIVAMLNPLRMTKVYETINIGRDGIISVVGTDGHVRAMHGLRDGAQIRVKPNAGALKRVQDKPFGTYINDGNFDGTERLVSYRKVDKLPLVVIVAVSTEHVLAGHAEVRRKYITAALGITAITLLVMLLSVIHRRRLDMAHDGLRRSEALARTKSSELQTTLENIDQGILMADAQGNLLVLNLRAVELLDLPREWLHARPNLKTLLRYLADRGEYGKNGELIDRSSWDNILNGGLDIPVGQHERTRPDGTVLEINARRLPDGGMVRTLTDVTERKRTEAEVARLATHDELTGLANRGLFRERVNAALNRARRHGDSFALMLFDLDRFKEINDSHGHPAGDAVLKEVGRRLALCVRERGVAARLGGDEFAILQTRARTDEEAAEFARHIIAAIRAPFVLDGENIPLATSIGITLVPRDGADYEQLVKKADQALYRAKERGGNIFCFSRTGTALRAPPDGTARAVA